MTVYNYKIKHREGTGAQIEASKFVRHLFYDTDLNKLGYYQNDLTKRYLIIMNSDQEVINHIKMYLNREIRFNSDGNAIYGSSSTRLNVEGYEDLYLTADFINETADDKESIIALNGTWKLFRGVGPSKDLIFGVYFNDPIADSYVQVEESIKLRLRNINTYIQSESDGVLKIYASSSVKIYGNIYAYGNINLDPTKSIIINLSPDSYEIDATTGKVRFNNNNYDIDLELYSESGSVKLDAGADELIFDGVDIRIKSNASIIWE